MRKIRKYIVFSIAIVCEILLMYLFIEILGVDEDRGIFAGLNAITMTIAVLLIVNAKTIDKGRYYGAKHWVVNIFLARRWPLRKNLYAIAFWLTLCVIMMNILAVIHNFWGVSIG